MSKNEIGRMDCPCCGEDASVRQQKNGRAYVMCNSAVCGFQGFTRSADADRHLRAKMKQAAADAPAQDQKQPDQPAPQPRRKGFFDGILD